MPTVAEIIQIGKFSTYLSANDRGLGALFGARIDPKLPLLIAMETDSIDWQNQFNPTDDTLQGSANYAYKIYGIYGTIAQGIISGGGSGTGVVSDISKPYLIPVLGSQFTNATDYDDARIVGKQLAIFWNDISRYLFVSEFAATGTGITITAVGWDAVANPTYELFIYIIDP